MSYIKQEAADDHEGYSGDHNPQSSQSSITAFLAKLWSLVNDSSCDDLIAWDPSGGSFHVYDQSRFAREVLPRYFKHNNFASFIRQLNMYGFRKLSTIEHGSLKNERDDIEFAHPHFLRGQESMLELIKRRAPDSQQRSNPLDSKTGRPIELSHILEDVRNLQTKQTSLSDKLSYMQTENQALWAEIGSLRQKHAKQQQIVSKLMEFLVRFITSNYSHHHENTMQQHPIKDGIASNSLHPGGEQTQYHAANEQHLSPNSLKRKYTAIMHTNDEPNKRTTAQQQQQQQQQEQQQQQFSYPTSDLGRQQSVTINELTDNDSETWINVNTPPVVDLVPSPPPAQSTDDNRLQQQQQNDYRYTASINEQPSQTGHEQRHPRQTNISFRATDTKDIAHNPYVPDFVLRTDNPNDTNLNFATEHEKKAKHIKTPAIHSIKQPPITRLSKEEQNEFAKLSQQNPVNNFKPVSTSYAQHKQDPLISQPSFSLDDITGDVDHIQSSLDNIRDFMFDNLPEGTTIEDLFGDENGLLSPLLQATASENNNSTGNLSFENIQDQKLHSADNVVDQQESTMNSQSVPNVNNQLFEQLMNESAIVEEQRHTIDQLAREKSDLEHRVHLLEQQANKRK